MAHAKLDSDLDLIAFAKTGAPPSRIEQRTSGPIVTNLRCAVHGSYTGTPDNVYCPACRAMARPTTSPLPPQDVGKEFFVLGPYAPYSYAPLPRPESLTDFATAVHRDNAHWWHDPKTGEKLERDMGEMFMLVVSEIAECMEGERKNLFDDHLPHRKMAEVELADAVIRLADIAGSRRYDIGGVYDWPATDLALLPDNKGAALYEIVRSLASEATTRGRIIWSLAIVISYATKHGYDLWGAVAEKREYNKHRADHKAAARLAPNGKKW